MGDRVSPGDEASERVASERKRVEAEPFAKSIHELDIGADSIIVVLVGTGEPESGQIHPDHAEPVAQRPRPTVPGVERGARAMEEQERWTVAFVAVVDLQSSDVEKAGSRARVPPFQVLDRNVALDLGSEEKRDCHRCNGEDAAKPGADRLC